MQTSISNSSQIAVGRSASVGTVAPWLMLLSRSALFLLFQGLIASILLVTGTTSAWDESARWWTFMAFLANFVSLYLLVQVFKADGKRF